ncbi:heavy-metal-associated domain-containing protein, partial [Tenacibaculum halocynthiae]|uniref:heavy-metal-associated domain-containing protein n=1 Tax=Tenacibaculum halocynthiae TaxID=1254437 RepID=UPI003D647FC7
MKATLVVQNLKCGRCAKTIISKVSELDSVSNVSVDVETSSVSFEYQDLDDALLVKEKLRKIGYPSV